MKYNYEVACHASSTDSRRVLFTGPNRKKLATDLYLMYADDANDEWAEEVELWRKPADMDADSFGGWELVLSWVYGDMEEFR